AAGAPDRDHRRGGIARAGYRGARRSLVRGLLDGRRLGGAGVKRDDPQRPDEPDAHRAGHRAAHDGRVDRGTGPARRRRGAGRRPA
ncbi:hypothetical protein LTR94_036458, partial [Friedmanniomyces endolithicus]